MAEELDVFGQFLRGEPQGIDLIVLAYRDPLISYGLKWVPRLDIVQDVVTETLIALPGKIGTFEDETHLKKSLHATVRNKCLNAKRELDRHATLSEKAENSANNGAPNEIDIRISDAHRRWIIQKILVLLQELPRQRREDFHAHFIEEKSIKEIAEERGRSIVTVRQNIDNALGNIRLALKKNGFPGNFKKS
jgi:RNA polymerase sigma factor (sigma-70 family)